MSFQEHANTRDVAGEKVEEVVPDQDGTIPGEVSDRPGPPPSIQRARLTSKTLSSSDILRLQVTVGNRAVMRLMAKTQQLSIPDNGSGKAVESAQKRNTGKNSIQRQVLNEDGEEASLNDIQTHIEDNMLEPLMKLKEIDKLLQEENEDLDRTLSIEEFLDEIGAVDSDDDQEMDEDDDEWDPAENAADPLEPDDILAGPVRKSLRFNTSAKNYMKLDTPKDIHGSYICHICKLKISKKDDVDMDHLPPWKDRLKAFITTHQLTEDDTDELNGPNMQHLYNLRGSVFAHSSCNRSHKGEDNYKIKWGNAVNWYNNGGGAPF
ncbi:MAG TPA: hypothetical protein VH186_20320 [Chloroflexia bacterium]|nr:hypothetical protein [Chloroflexia bacterium]